MRFSYMNESVQGNEQDDQRPLTIIRDPHFDDSLSAWVLTRHADVTAAFHSPELFPSGLNGSASSVTATSQRALTQMRRETQDALSPTQLRVWRRQLVMAARVEVKGLAAERSVDLIASYAKPLCLRLAAMVTGTSRSEAERLRTIAEPISASAAEPFDRALKGEAKAASTRIRGCFHSGPEPLRDSGFVALSYTLPCLLGNAWSHLIQSPHQWVILHKNPRMVEQAVEELLRCSGLPRILFRQAIDDLEFNGVQIRKGERVILHVDTANQDPDAFECPRLLDVRRRRIRQLALGAGPHSCVGAGLIRMAAVTLTRALVQRFSVVKLAQPIEWKGGSGFRFPAKLQVKLRLVQLP
jgi:cytochrome P450